MRRIPSRPLLLVALLAAAALAVGIVTAMAAPGAPTVAPFPALTNDRTPTFSWTPAGEAGGTYDWVVRPGNSSSGMIVAQSPPNYTATSATMPSLGDGSYNFRVRQNLNGAGPYSDPVRFTVDGTPPPSPALVAPADGAVVAGPHVLLQWSGVTDNGPAGLSHYVVTVDGAPVGGAIPPGTTQLQVSPGVGQHSWRVFAVDRAGNVSASPSRSFRVDGATPPAISVATSPAAPNAAGWFNQPVQVTFTCSADGGPPIVSCTGSTTVSEDTPAAGRVVTGTATNQAGLTASTSVTVRVDRTPPSAPALSGPGAGALLADRTPTLSWSAANAATSGLSRYRVLLDGGLAGETTGTSLTVPAALSQGTHAWQVIAVDNAGNQAGSSVRTFVVDTLPPTGGGLSIPPLTRSAAIPVSAAAAQDPNGPVAYGLSASSTAAPAGFSTSLPTSFSLSGDDGPKGVHLWARDAAGNAAAVASATTFLDRQAPSAPRPVSPLQDTRTNDPRPRLEWDLSTLADPAPSSQLSHLVVHIDGQPISGDLPLTATGFTPPADLADGVHDWHVRAVDRAGNASTVPAAGSAGRPRFVVDRAATAAPLITAGPAALGNVAAPAFAWTGLPGAVEFRWRVLRGGEPLGGAHAGTLPGSAGGVSVPALPDGAYSFEVTQRLAVGLHGAPAVRPFIVDTVAPGAPVITARPSASGLDAQPRFAWQGTEPGGRFEWAVLDASGAVVRAGAGPAASVTVPPLAAGLHVFRVAHRDAAGNLGAPSAPAAFVVEALPPPDPPGPPVPPITPPPGEGAGTTGEQGQDTGPPPTVGPTRPVRPPTRNASRLSPRAGAVVRVLRPVLRWRAARGARLYNIQIWEMQGTRLRKVVSAFPRTASFRVPAKRLRFGRRYVWRAWPFTAARSPAKQPVGVSFFDVRRPRAQAR